MGLTVRVLAIGALNYAVSNIVYLKHILIDIAF